MKWTTANGQVLSLKQIGDSHLVNILRMIESNLQVYGAPYVSMRVSNKAIGSYALIAAEAMRRGLIDWKPERKQMDSIAIKATKYADEYEL